MDLNNINRLETHNVPKRRSPRLSIAQKEIVRAASDKKEKKQHFKDHIPKVAKNEAGRNFHINQPDKSRNMNK